MARRDRSSSRPDRGKPRAAGKPRGPAPKPRAATPDPRAARPQAEPEVETSRLIYGRNPVREALRGRRRVKRIWATTNAAAEGWGGAKITIVDAAEIERLSGTDAHQGVCADVEPYPYADAREFLGVEHPLIVALDEVTDPQNLGAIARSAECAGATGLVVPERRSAEVTPAVCKASAGAVEHIPIARVRNLSDFLTEAKEAGCWTYGAAAEGSTNYLSPDYEGGVVLVLGAEGRGLRPRVAKSCDALVSLPLSGRIDSLNVSATAAVLLYAILQRRLDTST
jgi:23S rRNA (guanosine2251-2'-O)-methyltransferase